MEYPLQPGTAYFSAAEYYVLQIASQYCLRQIALVQQSVVFAENIARDSAGLDRLTSDEAAAIINVWGTSLSKCVIDQIPYVPALTAVTLPVGNLLLANIEWHTAQLLSLVPDLRLDRYANKCDNTTYPRVDNNTVWSCLCEQDVLNGTLLGCLTVRSSSAARRLSSTTEPLIGAPFVYDALTTIDEQASCSDTADWLNCLDWSRLDDYTGLVTSDSGPSTGPVFDDFDSLAVSYIEYIQSALMRNALLFASDTGRTQCPFGTLSSADGLLSLAECEKRLLLPILSDPSDLIIARLNPVNRPLSNTDPRRGNTVVNEEDMRFVFSIAARDFVTITFDFSDLPSTVQYGRDWRIVFFVNPVLAAEDNDKQQCSDIWSAFLQSQFVSTTQTTENSFTASVREAKLDAQGCAIAANPFAFEAFEYSTGTLCPNDDAECYFRYQAPSYFTPNECNLEGLELKVHEFYLHPVVDVELRLEIQIFNGMYMPDRFKFIQSVVVDTRSPSRAELGTAKAFVVEYNSDIASVVYFPYNLPLLPTAGTSVETEYMDVNAGSVNGTPAVSQRAVMTNSYLSWLPRDTAVPLSNCFKQTDAWDEYLFQPRSYFSADRTSVYQTHLPFFSNCRGYGRAIPLWHVVETSPGCTSVPVNETVAVSATSFGGKSIGDACPGIELECIVDEVPNDKQPIPRWFESPTGTELFTLSASGLTGVEYAELDENDSPLGRNVPVTIRSGSRSDGTWLRQVDLTIRYWQQSSTTKLLTTADVSFSKFEALTDSQSKGKSPWRYILKISYSPMSHIEVFNSYSFSFSMYFVFSLTVGAFALLIVLLHWGYHWLMSPMRAFATKLLDKRYWRLLLPAQLKGLTLALLPTLVSLMLFLVLFQGGIGEGMSFNLYVCDTSDSLGCKESMMDSMVSSWSGESLSNPNNYETRRNGRAAVMCILLGCYLLLHAMKAFIPNLVSHYYDKVGESEEPPDRSWPPDQQIFSPLVWKRSSWFLLIAANCLVCTLLLEFSYSELFTDLWWMYTLIFFLFGKLISGLVLWVMKEELLRIPIIAVYQTVVHVATLGSPDYYSFILTTFITQAMFLVDRIYITPIERFLGRNMLTKFKGGLTGIRFIFSGGRRTDEASIIPAGQAGQVGKHHEDDGQLASAEREHADGMLYFLAMYNANLVSAILTPILILLMTMLYTPTQSLNYYNVSPGQAKFYFGFQIAMFIFRYLADVVSLNTAELFHEWRLLDYLEYSHYRFINRPSRWKGQNEISDELITPELRSLDLFCFSSQFYFSVFLSSFGAILFLVGIHVSVNNAWDIFDDQATPLIFILGLAILGIIRFALLTAADYLKLWFVDRPDEKIAEDRAADAAFEEKLRTGSDEVMVVAPNTSALFNWDEPSAADKSGWERYRMAYLRENQLWLQAHMDVLVDGQTSIEYRRLLMETLSKLLKESNILELAAGNKRVDRISGAIRGLELNALPPHLAAVRDTEQQRNALRGTAVEAAAQIWLMRGRFLRFLQCTVAEIWLDSAEQTDCCGSCGKEGLELSPIAIYPLLYIADQFRIQRGMTDVWNVPLWQHFYKTFTPSVLVCFECRVFYSQHSLPVTRTQRIVPVARPCEQVIRESSFPLPILQDASIHLLDDWFEMINPGQRALPLLALPSGVDVNPAEIPDEFDEEALADIDDTSRAILIEWLRMARQLTDI